MHHTPQWRAPNPSQGMIGGQASVREAQAGYACPGAAARQSGLPARHLDLPDDGRVRAEAHLNAIEAGWSTAPH